jgi:hypothetical protein
MISRNAIASEDPPQYRAAARTVSAELMKLRAGLARDKVSRAQSIVQVVIAASCVDPELRTDVEECQLRDALTAASALLGEACDQLDEVNIAKPANDEERAALVPGVRS